MPSPEIANTHQQIMQWLSARGLQPTTQNLNRAQLALISNPELQGSMPGATSSGASPSMDEMLDRSMEREQRTGRGVSPSAGVSPADDAPEERTNRSNQRGGGVPAAASGARSPMGAVDAIDASMNADSAVKQTGAGETASDFGMFDALAAGAGTGAGVGAGWWLANQLSPGRAPAIDPVMASTLPSVPNQEIIPPFVGSQPRLPGGQQMLPGPEAMPMTMPDAMAQPNTVSPQNATIQAILANRANQSGGNIYDGAAARAAAGINVLPPPAARPPIQLPSGQATPNVIPLPAGPVTGGPPPMGPEVGQAAPTPKPVSGKTGPDGEAVKAALKKRTRTRAAARAVK